MVYLDADIYVTFGGKIM